MEDTIERYKEYRRMQVSLMEDTDGRPLAMPQADLVEHSRKLTVIQHHIAAKQSLLATTKRRVLTAGPPRAAPAAAPTAAAAAAAATPTAATATAATATTATATTTATSTAAAPAAAPRATCACTASRGAAPSRPVTAGLPSGAAAARTATATSEKPLLWFGHLGAPTASTANDPAAGCGDGAGADARDAGDPAEDVRRATWRAKVEIRRARKFDAAYLAEAAKFKVRVVNLDVGTPTGRPCPASKMKSGGMAFFVASVLSHMYPAGHEADLIVAVQNPGSRANARLLTSMVANHVGVDLALVYHSKRLCTILPLLVWPRTCVPSGSARMRSCQTLAITHHTGTELGFINTNAVALSPELRRARQHQKFVLKTDLLGEFQDELLESARCLPTLWAPVVVTGEFRAPLESGSPLSVVLGRLTRERQLHAVSPASAVSSMASLLEGSLRPSTCHVFVNQLIHRPTVEFAKLRVAYAGQLDRRSSALAAVSPPPLPVLPFTAAGMGRFFQMHPDDRPDLREALQLATSYVPDVPLLDQVPASVPYVVEFCLSRKPSSKLYYGGVVAVSSSVVA